MPLHHVKELLGHANISQNDTYLNAGCVALHESMKRFDDVRGKPVAGDHDSSDASWSEKAEPSKKERLH